MTRLVTGTQKHKLGVVADTQMLQGGSFVEHLVFESALGHTALARRNKGVLALTFGHVSERDALNMLVQSLEADHVEPLPNASARIHSVSTGTDPLVDRLREFALGQPDNFSDVFVDLSELTPFQRRVSEACRAIPWGETRTYSELAQAVGRSGAARAVGSVMSHNRVPLIIPCHRVVAAFGGLGGFSTPQGTAMKQRLLTMEQQAEQLC